MFKTAVIAIGGKGTRLKEITNNICKAEDQLQEVIDRNRLSDQRHILAVRV